MRMKWLHLSDIHFNYKNFDSRILRKDFITRITSLNESEKFTHLFITGDILDKYNSKDENNNETVKFINDLIDAMQIECQNVFIVPGNHDHNRDTTIKVTTDIYSDISNDAKVCEKIKALSLEQKDELLNAFSKFSDIYQEIFKNNYYATSENPHVIEFINDLSIIKINTSWLDIDSKDANNLYCGAEYLFDLLETNEEKLNQGVNIAIGHHPLGEIANSEKERILKLFSKYKIGLYFCGHVHCPSVTYFEEYDVLQLACIGGFADGYSKGGYIIGTCDTDTNLYKSEFYCWNEGSWYIESSLSGTNERGICYFDTKRFKNNSNIVAVDFKVLGEHIDRQTLATAIGDDTFDVLVYPNENINLSKIDWGFHEKNIVSFCEDIKHLSSKGKQVNLFPMAPIPLLIKLGFELQNNFKISIFQHNRKDNVWVSNNDSEDITFTVEENIVGNKELLVKISTSVEINNSSIENSFSMEEFDLLGFTASKIDFGSPLYAKDIKKLVETIFQHLNKIATSYNKIHLVAAVPAGMAVEIGRHLLKSVYSNIYTYQFYRGKYCHALTINGEDVDKSNSIIDNNLVYFEEQKQSVVFVPLVGNIACGEASEPIYEIDDYIPTPNSIAKNGQYFFLKAKGDSMVNAGIDDGDLILIRQQSTADNGQIVVALIDGSSTLKRFFCDDASKQIILKPENKAYKEKRYKNVDIQGIAIKVIKNIF